MQLVEMSELQNCMISKTLPCFTNVYASKIKTLVPWEDLEGAGGEGGGRGEWDGGHMQTNGCFISMYDKIHYK